jgi:hypothetical protein
MHAFLLMDPCCVEPVAHSQFTVAGPLLGDFEVATVDGDADTPAPADEPGDPSTDELLDTLDAEADGDALPDESEVDGLGELVAVAEPDCVAEGNNVVVTVLVIWSAGLPRANAGALADPTVNVSGADSPAAWASARATLTTATPDNTANAAPRAPLNTARRPPPDAPPPSAPCATSIGSTTPAPAGLAWCVEIFGVVGAVGIAGFGTGAAGIRAIRMVS